MADAVELATIKTQLAQIKTALMVVGGGAAVAIVLSIVAIVQIAMICHPGRATLELENGHLLRIKDASPGDVIRTPSGYEPIVAFTHGNRDLKATYFRLTTVSASIDIARGHWLMVNGRETDPKDVVVGDVLMVARPGTGEVEEPVVRIEQVIHRGAYHPITPSGRYYVRQPRF